jgi:hypothetical protein
MPTKTRIASWSAHVACATYASLLKTLRPQRYLTSLCPIPNFCEGTPQPRPINARAYRSVASSTPLDASRLSPVPAFPLTQASECPMNLSNLPTRCQAVDCPRSSLFSVPSSPEPFQTRLYQTPRHPKLFQAFMARAGSYRIAGNLVNSETNISTAKVSYVSHCFQIFSIKYRRILSIWGSVRCGELVH